MKRLVVVLLMPYNMNNTILKLTSFPLKIYSVNVVHIAQSIQAE